MQNTALLRGNANLQQPCKTVRLGQQWTPSPPICKTSQFMSVSKNND